MRTRSRGAIFFAALTVLWTTAASAQDVWDEAEQSIRRLPADSFPGVPQEVRAAMRRLNCVVPQGSDSSRPHNVLAGHFASPEQVDWAFLCSASGANSIHVLWGGPQSCPTPLGEALDRDFLQGLGGGRIGFSRRLNAVDRERMLQYQGEFGGPPVPEVRHQGIEDLFEGKASWIHLCVDGVWITLQGAD